jgi:hypothetical protein
MQPITERVSHDYFDQPSPRPFPYEALPNLIVDHLIRPGLRRLLAPLIVVGLLIVVGAELLHAPWYVSAVAYLLVATQLLRGIHHALRRMQDEIALMRYGLAVRAHVLRMRTY